MTRDEFNTGWNTLRGAGLRGAMEADQNVYFSALYDMEPRLWSMMVSRIVKTANDQWFPSVPQMYGYMAATARELVAADKDAKREQTSRLGCDPKTGDPFVQQHPALVREPNEGPLAYAARLAMKLGHTTKVVGDPVRRMPEVREVRLPYKEPDDAAWEQIS